MPTGFTFADLFCGAGEHPAALAASDDARGDLSDTYLHMAAEEGKPLHQPTPHVVAVPNYDVLARDGARRSCGGTVSRRGMDNDVRGTLLWGLERILQSNQPRVVVLEDRQKLAGARPQSFNPAGGNRRNVSYAIDTVVASPHLLAPDAGGAPQSRPRFFLIGTRLESANAAAERQAPEQSVAVVRRLTGYDSALWRIEDYLDPDASIKDLHRYQLTDKQMKVVDLWNDFLSVVDSSEPLPGYPIWADALRSPANVPAGTPTGREAVLRENAAFYLRNQSALDAWRTRHEDLRDFEPSYRKLEWQAGNAPRDLWACVLQLRPSGLRAKKLTYLPALVASAQTSIIGPRRRRLTPREAARLQGLPEAFELCARDAESYKQLGNAVNVGVVQHLLERLVSPPARARVQPRTSRQPPRGRMQPQPRIPTAGDEQ